jgi:uncharacterized protein (DUF1499 family)
MLSTHIKSAFATTYIIGLLTIIISGVAMAESQQRLQPCPSSPNCVCSDATDGHGIEPIVIAGDAQMLWKRLQDYLAQQRGFTIKQVDDNYLRVEAKTRLLRFVDDVEFELRVGQGVIAVRSASRVGYSDLGVNRRRIERIRKELEPNRQKPN